MPYHPHPHIIICTSFISSIDYNVFIVLHLCRKVTWSNNLLLLHSCYFSLWFCFTSSSQSAVLDANSFTRSRGTGMIASSSTFRPHQGRVIRDQLGLLHAVRLGTEALVYSNHLRVAAASSYLVSHVGWMELPRGSYPSYCYSGDYPTQG